MNREQENYLSRLPETQPVEIPATEILTPVESEAIITRVNIRRQQLDLRKSLTDLGDAVKDARYALIVQNVYQEMSGETGERSLTDMQTTILRRKAIKAEEIDPRHAAYLYAMAAKSDIACGQTQKEDVDNANRCLGAAKDYAKTSPSHLLPQAILLGVEKKH